MSEITKVSDTLEELRAELQERRDSEIQTAGEVLAQYVTDHNDKAAYREIDRKVTRLARAWDRMLSLQFGHFSGQSAVRRSRRISPITFGRYWRTPMPLPKTKDPIIVTFSDGATYTA